MLVFPHLLWEIFYTGHQVVKLVFQHLPAVKGVFPIHLHGMAPVVAWAASGFPIHLDQMTKKGP